jgi:hypothetical protein
MTIAHFKQFEIEVSNEVIYRVENFMPSDQESITFDSSLQSCYPIGEAVRKVVNEYGEVLQRLANE